MVLEISYFNIINDKPINVIIHPKIFRKLIVLLNSINDIKNTIKIFVWTIIKAYAGFSGLSYKFKPKYNLRNSNNPNKGINTSNDF